MNFKSGSSEEKEVFNDSLNRFVEAIIEKNVDKLLTGLDCLLSAIEDGNTFNDFIWARGRHQLGRIYYTKKPFKAFVYSTSPRVPFNYRDYKDTNHNNGRVLLNKEEQGKAPINKLALPKGAKLFENGQVPIWIINKMFKEYYSECDDNIKPRIRQWIVFLEIEPRGFYYWYHEQYTDCEEYIEDEL